MIIANVSACCGNKKPEISSKTIQPGESATLTQLVKRTKPGPFQITSMVTLKTDSNDKLLYKIRGEAIQPLCTKIGWLNKSTIEVDYNNEITELPLVNKDNSNILKLELSTTNNPDLSQNNILKVKSQLFSVLDSTNNKGTPPNNIYLYLKLKSLLPNGVSQDKITVCFKNGTECHIPIIFRVTGDVYIETSTLNIGKVPPTGIIEKRIKVLFTEKTKPWSGIKWRTEGFFSNAIDIFLDKDNSTNHFITLIIKIKNAEVKQKKAFIHSTIYLSGNSNNSNELPLIIYGYK